MHSPRCDSPSTIDEPLEYITVESYNWPKPTPSKRHRLDDDEKRRRHSECQKRFLARKQRLVRQLPVELAKLELQLKLVKAVQEARELQIERDFIFLHLCKLSDPEGVEGRARDESTCCVRSQTTDDDEEEVYLEALVVESLNVDLLVAELGNDI
jgi:hypothetical protein